MLRRDDSTIPIDEEELSSNHDTEFEHIENSKHEQSSSSNNDLDYDTE
jgi:hypothetical protein